MTPAEEAPAEPSRRQRLAIARQVVQGALATPRHLPVFLLKRIMDAHISRAAAALSFSTALALILATLAAFPAFGTLRTSLQNAIVANLVPDTGMKVNEALTSFVGAAGQLTLFGVIGLVLTAVFLLPLGQCHCLAGRVLHHATLARRFRLLHRSVALDVLRRIGACSGHGHRHCHRPRPPRRPRAAGHRASLRVGA